MPLHREVIEAFRTDRKTMTKGLSFNDFLDMMYALGPKISFLEKRDWFFAILKQLEKDTDATIHEDYLNKNCLQRFLEKITPTWENESDPKKIVEELLEEAYELDEKRQLHQGLSRAKFNTVLDRYKREFYGSLNISLF